MAGEDELAEIVGGDTRTRLHQVWYGMWEEPLRVADDEAGNARYRQNERGLLPPVTWWREVPCGHPQSPVAWLMPHGSYVCHCGQILAATADDGSIEVYARELLPYYPHPDGVVYTCGKCGCHVLVLLHYVMDFGS